MTIQRLRDYLRYLVIIANLFEKIYKYACHDITGSTFSGDFVGTFMGTFVGTFVSSFVGTFADDSPVSSS